MQTVNDPTLKDVILAFIELIKLGGPEVIMFSIAGVFALLAWTIYWIPHIIKPIASAIKLIRSGSSEREAQLEKEIDALRAKVYILEERDDKYRKSLQALLTYLESTNKDDAKSSALFAMIKESIAAWDYAIADSYHKFESAQVNGD